MKEHKNEISKLSFQMIVKLSEASGDIDIDVITEFVG